MNKLWIILAVLVALAASGYWLAYNVSSPETQAVVSVPIPDPRIAELEARVKTLEDWAVRQ